MGQLRALPYSGTFPFPGSHAYALDASTPPDPDSSSFYAEEGGESTTSSSPREWTRAELRAHILTHSLQGAKMAKDRQPFIGQLVSFNSPADPEVIFGIRRLDNAAIMIYRDKDATVRYIMEDGTDRVITEKDYPMGTRRLDVVLLGLSTWNITDSGAPVDINRESVLKYLDPDGGELDAIYDKILEVNPVLNGQQARKNS